MVSLLQYEIVMIKMDLAQVYIVKNLRMIDKKLEMKSKLTLIQVIANLFQQQEYYKKEALQQSGKVIIKMGQAMEFMQKF